MPTRFFMVALLACAHFLSASAATFAATEKEYPELNFAITPPDGWMDISDVIPKHGVYAFSSSKKTSSFMVFRDDNDPPAKLDDRFVTEFERGEKDAGNFKRLSDGFVFVQGIKSYERTGLVVARGRTVSMLSRVIPIQGHFYHLQGARWDGRNAGEDTEIRLFLESFRFLTPPPLATADPATPKWNTGLGAVFHRGNDTANAMLARVTLTAIAAGIVFLVIRRRRARSQQSPPPPLAPNLQNGP
jgi:hypothetical protein